MLWIAILYYHFPLEKDYGVAHWTSITGTSTKLEYLVVKIARAESWGRKCSPRRAQEACGGNRSG